LQNLDFVHRNVWTIQVTPKGFPLLDAILPQIVTVGL
jgi:hypothetical protein